MKFKIKIKDTSVSHSHHWLNLLKQVIKIRNSLYNQFRIKYTNQFNKKVQEHWRQKNQIKILKEIKCTQNQKTSHK